ncbi:MAG: PBP1A family penicillin-binding protein [Acidobacteria bacterium]|nr:PBP1A family penicillin-binding protein [Acidobacteriota bacterium]
MGLSRNPFAGQVKVVFALVVAALAGGISGVMFAFSPDLPEVATLDDYAPSTITRVFAAGGEEIGQFATERRVIIGYNEIPEVLRHAIISSEDAAFFEHFGFNIRRLGITVIQNVLKWRLRGASTLTMQLARHVSLNGGAPLGLEKVPSRKLNEALITIQIEKRYTKREILTLYCNQMYLGSGAYGVEAASRLYFGKPALELELSEAAMIAGIFQLPSRQSPLVNPAWARERRDYVLSEMRDNGYITDEEAEAAIASDIVLAERTEQNRTIGSYFVEEVRQHLEATYGASSLYEDGLEVHTTLDARLQAAADTAVQRQLRVLDKSHGYRAPTRNVTDEGHTTEDYADARWQFAIAEGDIVPAVVTSTAGDALHARAGRYTTVIPPDGFRWTRRRRAEELAKPGDLVEVHVVGIDDAAGTLTTTLEQEPELEAALLAIDNRTGQILAMVGGYEYERSKFNRATQAKRQLGSLFKGIVFTAAIDQGYTAASIIMDEPISIIPGPNQAPYEPANYKNEFLGPVTLRYALEKSINVPAVQLMHAMGPETVVSYAPRFGITSEIPPLLSVALGSAETTLQEITSAYSVFPNRGVRMTPYQITRISDREGMVLEENRPEAHDTIRADTAYVMVSIFRGVVERGTGQGARQLNWPVGGKTGTVDDFTDGWFVGFDPDITVGVWVGFDTKRSLGSGQDGASVALPIWRDFMQAYIEDRPAPGGFVPPSNIVFVTVDGTTGQVTEPWAPNAIQEAFVANTQPGSLFQD